MAQTPAQPSVLSESELRSLETSVLRSLCLTINRAGSERKYKILESLSAEDFYFEPHPLVFRSLAVMHRRGDYVVFANLEGELRDGDASVPDGFSLDSLFQGTPPELEQIGGLVQQLKERSRSGLKPRSDLEAKKTQKTSQTSSAKRARGEGQKKMVNQKKSASSQSNPKVADFPELEEEIEIALDEPLDSLGPSDAPEEIALETEEIEIHLDSDLSSPSVATPEVKSTPAAAAKASSSPPLESKPRVVVSAPSAPVKKPALAPKPVPTAAPSSDPVLASESDDWSDYMDELASLQGKRFETGFRRLDERLEGLTPGLVLVVDDDTERRINFLKQLTDQMSGSDRLRTLFVASASTRASLRLRTLSRLAGVPADDIEKGRLRKDSVEWQRVEQQGRSAAKWLKRLFVHEAPNGIKTEQIKKLVDKMVAGFDDVTPMVIVDALDRSNTSQPQRLKALKQLSELTDAVVIAATADASLISSPGIDVAAVFQVEDGQLELQVLPSGDSQPVLVKFEYRSPICQFQERSS